MSTADVCVECGEAIKEDAIWHSSLEKTPRVTGATRAAVGRGIARKTYADDRPFHLDCFERWLLRTFGLSLT